MPAHRSNNGFITGLLALSGAIALSVALAAPSSGARTSLPGSVPSWATTKNLQGAPDPATAVGFRIYLGWTDPDGAVALAKSVSDPHSGSYGHYLTPNQF